MKTILDIGPLTDKMDKCISCGKDTKYPVNMHVDYRFHYIEGAGQLCKECYDKIYKLKNV